MATFGLYSAICYGLTLSAVAIYSVGSWHAPTFNDIADGRPSSVKFCWGHRPPTLRGSICFRLLAYGGPPVFMHSAGKSSSNRFLNFCFSSHSWILGAGCVAGPSFLQRCVEWS